MELNKEDIKKLLLGASFLIIFYWALQNLMEVFGWVQQFIGLFTPIFLGLGMAFIINIPMNAIEKRLFSKVKHSKLKEVKRPISLLLAIALIITIIIMVFVIIIPELARTISIIKDSIPGFLKRAEVWMKELTLAFPEMGSQIALTINWAEWGKKLFEWFQQGATLLAGSTFTLVSGVFSGLFTFVLGFVLSIYVLLQKEKLGIQAKKILYAYLKEDKVDHFIGICTLTSKAFSNFFTGQCLEAVILGLMFFVAMGLFKFPYALMISVTIGFTALIPIFGAFLGCFIGVFLMLVTNPEQVIWFVVLFFVLQQLEGNLIYPRVVGNSVGLPGIWVLIAVTVGGNMLGVLGMLIMVPLFSVVYVLLGESANKRLAIKKVAKAKIIGKLK